MRWSPKIWTVGEGAQEKAIGGAKIRFVTYQKDGKSMAKYYQAADLYLHATRADTFPTMIIEALACGIPVIATSVGGIPDQINELNIESFASEAENMNRYGPEEATGILVPKSNAEAMAEAAVALISNRDAYLRLSRNAVEDSRRRFDLNRQVNEYLDWYYQILSNQSKRILIKNSMYTM